MNRGYEAATSAWSQVGGHHGAHMMAQAGNGAGAAAFGMLGGDRSTRGNVHAFGSGGNNNNGSAGAGSNVGGGVSSKSGSSMSAAKLRYESARCFDCDDDIEFNPALTQEELASAFAESSLSSRSSDSSSPQQQQTVPQGMNAYAMRNVVGQNNGHPHAQHGGHHGPHHHAAHHQTGHNMTPGAYSNNGNGSAHGGHHHGGNGGGRNYRKRNPIAIIDPRYQGQGWR